MPPNYISDPEVGASFIPEESQSSSLNCKPYEVAEESNVQKIDTDESGVHESLVTVVKGLHINDSQSERTADTLLANAAEGLPRPQRVLFPIEKVQLGWQKKRAVGAGMRNMGNTCYLNSILQALFHIPALANWLDKEVSNAKLNQSEACLINGMRATLMASHSSRGEAISPSLVYSKLRLISRHLKPGRQEDAHELLRYLVEAIEKSYLKRLIDADLLDQYTKETTPLNQILGGYLRSTVRCHACDHLSTTYQYFQDLLLDISKHQTLEQALDSFFSQERLEDFVYKCEACNNKVPATKRFFIERAPMVLCIALKRFTFGGDKLSKHVQYRKKIKLNKFMYSQVDQPQLTYKLVSVVTHFGSSQNCGHYTAIGLAPNGNYYHFDDSYVERMSLSGVLGNNAYIMFFEKENITSQSDASPSNISKYESHVVNNTNEVEKLTQQSKILNISNKANDKTKKKKNKKKKKKNHN